MIYCKFFYISKKNNIYNKTRFGIIKLGSDDMHIAMDKVFLPVFYSFCVIGIIVAGFCLANVREEQKEQLLTIEKSLNMATPNEEVQLELNEEHKNDKVVYISSDEDIVKVDEYGRLESISEGSATVTVKTKNKKYVQSFVVNVGDLAIEEYGNKKKK